jgi:hypothetical protein
VTHTRCHIDTMNSPDDEHMAARNMQRIEINVHGKGTVRQVGYLQLLYQDARSTEHKTLQTVFNNQFTRCQVCPRVTPTVSHII